MLALILFAASWASATPTCSTVDLASIVAIEPPAIVILGARNGAQPDLSRAGNVVRQLSAVAPVMLALEAVHVDKQHTLDDFADGQVEETALQAALEWENHWGFPYPPYKGLVTGAKWDVDVIAAGPTNEAPVKSKRFPIPGGYAGEYTETLGDNPLEKGMETRFARAMAWKDNRIAHYSQQSWNRKGFLVVVANRTRVEGGLGVPWQLERMSDGIPVHTFMLHYGSNPPCHPGDRLWQESFPDTLFRQWGWRSLPEQDEKKKNG